MKIVDLAIGRTIVGNGKSLVVTEPLKEISTAKLPYSMGAFDVGFAVHIAPFRKNIEVKMRLVVTSPVGKIVADVMSDKRYPNHETKQALPYWTTITHCDDMELPVYGIYTLSLVIARPYGGQLDSMEKKFALYEARVQEESNS